MQNQPPYLLRHLKAHKQSITALSLHPKCKYLISAGIDSAFLVWDLKNQTPPHKYQGFKGQVLDLKIHPNGNIIASSYTTGMIKFWEIGNQIKNVTIKKAHISKIRTIDYSCDGNLLASAGDDKIIKIWSTVDRRLQSQYKKHQNWIRSCQFSPISQTLISCDDRFVLLWDLQSKKILQQYKQHNGVIHQCKFHSLGQIIASCSHDRKIKIYDLRARQVVQIYEGHTAAVKSVDFHPRTAHLISSAEDGTMKIWNTQMNRLQYTIQVPSNTTKFSLEGDYFISGGTDKAVCIWKTGFYDSFTQKITPQDSGLEKYQQKVKCEINPPSKHLTSTQSDQQPPNPTTTNKTPEQPNKPTDISLLYCHNKQNFQLPNPNSNSNIQSNYLNPHLKKQLIPLPFQRKLQKMNTQIDFITKTTQILQARVLNNGQHLRRLVEMIEQGKNN